MAGNYIGTDVTGTMPLGNGRDGLQLSYGATNNTIGGTTAAAENVVSSNGGSGVYFFGAPGNVVAGDFIGTDRTGTVALGNGIDGVRIINSTNATVGGTSSTARNIISANGEDGIQIDNPGTTRNLVEGNFIGTNAAGTSSLSNHRDGVYLNSGASGNTIGSAATGGGNVISGNASYGVIIDGSSNNTVAGDWIGTDPTGKLALPNQYDGVHIVDQSVGNTIGGTTAAARDVISGNGEDGVQIDFAGALPTSSRGIISEPTPAALPPWEITGRRLPLRRKKATRSAGPRPPQGTSYRPTGAPA